jgi:hypothetical protein
MVMATNPREAYNGSSAVAARTRSEHTGRGSEHWPRQLTLAPAANTGRGSQRHNTPEPPH